MPNHPGKLKESKSSFAKMMKLRGIPAKEFNMSEKMKKRMKKLGVKK